MDVTTSTYSTLESNLLSTQIFTQILRILLELKYRRFISQIYISEMNSTICENLSERHTCNCAMCVSFHGYRYYMIRCFVLGFVIPVFWIVNVMLYIHLRFFNSTAPVLCLPENEILLTEFELQSWREKNVFASEPSSSCDQDKKEHFKKSLDKNLNTKNLCFGINANFISSLDKDSIQNSSCSSMVKDVSAQSGIELSNSSFSASDILEGLVPEMISLVLVRHQNKDQNLRNWALRSLSCIVGYALVIVFTFLAIVAQKTKPT